jgi:hypothetical protein
MRFNTSITPSAVAGPAASLGTGTEVSAPRYGAIPMVDDDRLDWEASGLNAAGAGKDVHRLREPSINGWQIAGALLVLLLLAPALVTERADDWADGLGLTLLSSPLLAWLFIPLHRSADLFDETARKRTGIVDALALVLLWTWPWTCLAPIVAIGRCIEILLPSGL